MTKQELNEFYKPQYKNAEKLSQRLNDDGFKNRLIYATKRFENADSDWHINYFPCPVLQLELARIGLDMFGKKYAIEAFLEGRALKRFDFNLLISSFEKSNLTIYDCADCTVDYFHKGMTSRELIQKIKELKPTTLGIAFETPKQPKPIERDLNTLTRCYT